MRRVRIVLSWTMLVAGVVGFAVTFPAWLFGWIDDRAMLGVTPCSFPSSSEETTTRSDATPAEPKPEPAASRSGRRAPDGSLAWRASAPGSTSRRKR